MRTLIAYVSKHGTTREVAYRLGDALGDAVDMYDPSDAKAARPRVEDYDIVVLGSPVYAGKWPKPMGRFIVANKDEIAKKKLAIFIVGIMKESGTTGLSEAMPAPLKDKILLAEKFGGAFKWRKLSPFERLIVKAVVGVSKDYSNIDWDRVEALGASLKTL
jgi:menaquinone-dependent protoporphyrinogen oxidase